MEHQVAPQFMEVKEDNKFTFDESEISPKNFHESM
jgi:hypothetical protein